VPIEFNCDGCGKTLRVPDEHAGKQARCPGCQTVLTVPSPPHDFAPLPSANLPPDSGTSWHVRTADGQSYGPIGRAELERWTGEGRIAADAQVRKEGETQWQWASTVLPQLGGGHSDNPYGAPKPSGDASVYRTPAAAHVEPHRGGMILAFAIIGLMICPIFSPIAFFMGRSDLKSMDAGYMDREGHGLTTAGYIIGMIHCILFLVIICLYAVILCAALSF
jgi:hypothetical protein